MKPDSVAYEAYMAGINFARRELAAKRAQSRAAQPRRKDNKTQRPTRSR